MIQDNMSSSCSNFDLNQFLSITRSARGKFEREVLWSYKVSSDTGWNKNRCRITDVGSLRCYKKKGAFNLMDHLQNCHVRFIEQQGESFPTIQVSVKNEKSIDRVYLRVQDGMAFQELVCAFMWWGGLRTKGIFRKFAPRRPILEKKDSIRNILVSKIHVFGPILEEHIVIDRKLDKPDFLPKSKFEEGWFPAKGVLRSNGMFDLLLQGDDTLIYSLNIPVLLRSEIRIPDPSLENGNYLFLRVIPDLRRDLKILRNEKFIRTSKQSHNSTILLKFPLRIDVEDWFVALKSFAIAENFSLIGADKSNNIRVSNSFCISILEGRFNESEFGEELPSLYVELSMWGCVWSRTPIVNNSLSPFWREVFTFHESLLIKDLKLRIKKKSFDAEVPDETVGQISLSQENINDPNLVKETRLPVMSPLEKDKEIGKLCIKIASSLILVLPSSNFRRMEKLLHRVDPEEVYDLIQHFSDGTDIKIDGISGIFLDIFQAIGRENEWFSAMLKKELSAIDDSIARNTIHNKTSSHIYSTLFRGNSILTISMEKYFNRVGHEYLEECIGDTLRDIINEQVDCELDPAKIEESDPELKQQIVAKNRETLCHYSGLVWHRIYTTSNDLPMSIREQMGTFRQKLELICMEDDFNTTLNCVSGVLFLRFFCPVILNPKLFNLVSQHLNGTSHKTLTLICKVLLNLSNITYFGNKSPSMIVMNEFIDSHKAELLDYIDKVTLKKLDFSPKRLRLEERLPRPNLMVDNKELKELPIVPYLIDKHLRETEMFTFLACLVIRGEGNRGLFMQTNPELDSLICDRPVMGQKPIIRGLEFEKITENNTEVFGNDLLKYLDEDETFMPSDNNDKNSNLNNDVSGQLKQESMLLYHKIGSLTQMLTDYEFPSEIVLTELNYPKLLADNIYVSKDKRLIINLHGDLGDVKGLKKLFDLQTKRSSLFDNILQKGSAEGFSTIKQDSGHASSPEKYSSTGKNISGFKSKRLPKIMTGNSSSSDRDKNPGKLKRLFKRS